MPPKGKTNNPNGRPPKSRQLTLILERALSHTVTDGDAKTARKRILARLVSEAATEGRATFPDGTVLQLAPRDWMEFVKWIYSHIDGPPKAEMDVTSGGEPIRTDIIRIVVHDDRENDGN